MAAESAEPFRRRVVGMFALATMEREGPIHGYRLAERIADCTEGAWRPGPGAIYPALQLLVRQELARSRPEGRRRVYAITPAGRRILRTVRERGAWFRRGLGDHAALWAEVQGITDLDTFFLDRFRAELGRVEARVAQSRGGSDRLRTRLRLELTQALARLDASAPLLAVPGRRARA